jgi:hypothetical protein
MALCITKNGLDAIDVQGDAALAAPTETSRKDAGCAPSRCRTIQRIFLLVLFIADLTRQRLRAS